MLENILADHGLTIWHVWGAIAVIAIVLWLMYILGAAVNPYGGHYIGSAGDMARGGCVLIILSAAGLVIVAVLVWAWRTLFGE